MTAQDIILQARERLGDINKQRWSDNRLLSIVSQGQVEICLVTNYVRKLITLPLNNGENIYTLPSDCYSIKRIEYNGKLLPLYTRSDQDLPRAVTTDYVAYKSNLDMRKLEIQPEVEGIESFDFVDGTQTTNTSFVVTPFIGVITASNDPAFVLDNTLGAVTGMAIDISNNAVSNNFGEIAGTNRDEIEVDYPSGNFGVTTAVTFSSSTKHYGFVDKVVGYEISGIYGLLGDVAYEKDTFKVYYVAVPQKLNYLTAQLVLPELWEEILMRYVVGTALQDDNDANNIARGEAELQKYAGKLAVIRDLSSKDFSANTSSKNETGYRSI